jgi:hypothetical protein
LEPCSLKNSGHLRNYSGPTCRECFLFRKNRDGLESGKLPVHRIHPRNGGGNASQRGSLDKISPIKSPVISPDLESGMPSNRSPRIVRGTAKKWQVSHRHRSPDYALIRETSPESLPDTRSSHQKSGVLFKHFAWHECLKRDLGREFGRPTRLSLSTALKRDSQKWAVLF